MKVMAFNGSPRKKWNTATLLAEALQGAASQGAETELIHLYDLNFKGCISCFACKTIGGKSYGRCAVKDGLTPILEKIEAADALILGSPVYFCTVSGEMRSFMERLLFPYFTYTTPPQSLFPKKIPTGFIYTMNVTEEQHYCENREIILLSERILPKKGANGGQPEVRYFIFAVLHEVVHAIKKHKSKKLDHLTDQENHTQEEEADAIALEWFNKHVAELNNPYITPLTIAEINEMREKNQVIMEKLYNGE